MNIILQIFIVGVAILIGAIIINLLVSVLGLATWYTFLIEFKEKGFSQGIFSLIFLFLIYPFLLGLIGYYVVGFLK
ncbi:MAG: hypothetical protein ABIA37_03340 [Candidatus Woesearchaeota archaeon]